MFLTQSHKATGRNPCWEEERGEGDTKEADGERVKKSEVMFLSFISAVVPCLCIYFSFFSLFFLSVGPASVDLSFPQVSFNPSSPSQTLRNSGLFIRQCVTKNLQILRFLYLFLNIFLDAASYNRTVLKHDVRIIMCYLQEYTIVLVPNCITSTHLSPSHTHAFTGGVMQGSGKQEIT